MTNINVDICDGATIDAAIARLQAIESELAENKVREFCRKLAESGADVVNMIYSGGVPYAGDIDVATTVEESGNGYAIRAFGSALGFIEFGTGAGYPLGEFANQVGAPAHGTYGQKRGAHPPWLYAGEPGTLGRASKKPGLYWTDGNPPANAFPQAVERIKGDIGIVAQEVFTFD